MRTRRALSAAGFLVALGAHVASVHAGAGDAPLPTFSDGKPGQLVQLLPTVIKTNNLDTDVFCTNISAAPNVDVGFEVFDETGASRNLVDVHAGVDGVDVKLNLPVGATVTFGTAPTLALHEDIVIRLNAAGNGINALKSGSGRVVASGAGVRCVAFAVDSLHDFKDPATCSAGFCIPPALTLLSDTGCTPDQCNDNNPCTTDTCDGSGGCRHTPNEAGPCDDADACTSADVCNAGVCAGTPVVCGVPCSQSGTCDTGSGTCVGTTPFSTCAPGGGNDPATDCAAESVVDNPTSALGRTSNVQSCTQGDPQCDFDVLRKRCTFHVQVCLNNHDVNLPGCVAPGVRTYELRAPASGALRRTVLEAVGALAASTREGKAHRRVAFATPLTATDQCTAALAIPVSLGKALALKVLTTTASGSSDADRLKLKCSKPRRK